MPELAKALLIQLDETFEKEVDESKRTTVQFNPESLKVTFANQIATPSGAGDQKGSPARLFVGAGTTKLAVQLWFDVSSQPSSADAVDDVRELTKKIAFFITPVETKDKKFVPPAVRFLWGTFMFDGIMEGMEETLEFFSGDGRPLRASVSISLTQQKIQFLIAPRNTPPGAQGAAGTQPLTQAPQGSTMQGLAASQGKGSDWQGIAEANNVENPRQLEPGQPIDMNRTTTKR